MAVRSMAWVVRSEAHHRCSGATHQEYQAIRSHTTTRMTEHTMSGGPQNDGSKSPKEDLGLRRKASIRDSEHIDADKDERRQNKEKTRGGKARRSWRRPERPNVGAPEIALRFVF
ncbi:hypothetical protein F2Q70_00036386 [Brassica cretica]|uniref:Uncharacterized protein n=1 Tax=Brassica cretica TaxID=69181 RepID=A0A8S9GIY5_BRACR|nr:hypothetical protein F2Q68_00031588 [Brassica cretica]KAF2587213.1 hypothetical protein F2Q70_00036386 [Brassica cretica]